MLRFTWNRSWAFVLTLCLFTVCSLLLTTPVPSAATPTSTYMPADEQPSPPSMGDPDVPMGPGDGKVGKYFVSSGGERSQVLRQNGAYPVGDGLAPASVLMNRLRLIALSLRSFYLRF